jgi:hypothetical protein
MPKPLQETPAFAVRHVPLADVRENPDNPRTITDVQFQRLVRSVKQFPQMLALRPLVVDAGLVVLGGNMRLKACREAGLDTVPVVVADTLTPKQRREFVIKDNASYGAWDWDALANEWSDLPLADWGVDGPAYMSDEQRAVVETLSATETDKYDESKYTAKVEAPIYEPKGEQPPIASTYENGRYLALLKDINGSNVSAAEKEMLTAAASRHIVFNYQQMADYYAHASPSMQRLMEDSALVIIDFDRAIELGYVKISNELLNYVPEDLQDAESH